MDFLFPAVYGLFFATATTFGFSPLFPNRPALQKLSLLPLLTTLFDYAENLCLLAILRSFPVELPGKARQRIHPRQVDFRRSQYRIVAGGNFGFADSQSSSSSFCLEAWTGFQFELTHRGASLHA